MKTSLPITEKSSLASCVAPEDLVRGDFVALLSELVELPACLWCDPVSIEQGELIRLRFLPSGGNMPLKVVATCLPLVCVKSATGEVRTLDVRQVQLFRLQKSYARIVWKELRKNPSKSTRKS